MSEPIQLPPKVRQWIEASIQAQSLQSRDITRMADAMGRMADAFQRIALALEEERVIGAGGEQRQRRGGGGGRGG
jgi:hypothetical protein